MRLQYAKMWTGSCQRCGKVTSVYIMSKFNTALICMGCDHLERQLPEYAAACEADEAAIRRGDYNFPGIGLPEPPKIDDRPANIFRQA